MDFKQLFKSWVLIAVGVFIAAHTSSGIHYESGGALVVAVLLLSLFNLVLKPILMIFTLPFIIFSLGIGIWLINAVLFLLVSKIVPEFYVDSFWNALWGALVVSLTGAAASFFFGSNRVKVQVNRGGSSNQAQPKSRESLKDDDVIDI